MVDLNPGPSLPTQPYSLRRVIIAVLVAYLANALLIAAAEQLLIRVLSGTKYYVADVVIQCVIQVGCGLPLFPNLKHNISDDRPDYNRPSGRTYSLATSWHVEPHWYAVALIVMYSPCVWIGYRLACRGAESRITVETSS